MKSLRTAFLGELVGTFILTFFGCGVVAASVTTGAQSGVFQVAIVWGLGVALAIYSTAALSGAHLNPAVTISLAVHQRFPVSRVLPYIVAQLSGAFLAASTVFVFFADALSIHEAANGLTRGLAGSEGSAMVFGEFFPNPGGKPLAEAKAIVTHLRAFGIEVIATAVLMLVILAVTDERNKERPAHHAPVLIGLTVTLLISICGPLTMACFNPARDLGPRLFSAVAGWGSVPFTANGIGWLTVYIVAPVLGAVLGGFAHRLLLKPGYAEGS
jgi:glycerol uptake facilitator protein